MKAKLTAPFVSKLQARHRPYEVYDTDLQGLTLRVEESATKTYYFRYRLGSGQRRRMRIGLHGPVKPPIARDIASKILAEVAHGEDPARRRKEKRANTDTLGGYIENVYASWAVGHQKSGR